MESPKRTGQLRCPKCQKRLRGRRVTYGTVYVCVPCGLIIIKVPNHFRKIVGGVK